MSPETYLNTTSMLGTIRRDRIEEETQTKPKLEEMLANVHLRCLTEMQLNFVSAWSGNLIAAARAAGYSNPRAAAYKLMRDPDVVKALQIKQESMLQQSGEQFARTLPLSRADVIDRLWQLAQLSPERTNGTVTGQVKAAQALEQVFALNMDRSQALKRQLQGKSEAEFEFYVVHGFLPSQQEKNILQPPAEAPQLPQSTGADPLPMPEPAGPESPARTGPAA